MEITYHPTNIILILFLIVINTNHASISAIADYNPFMAVCIFLQQLDAKDCFITFGNSTYQNKTYISTFPNTVDIATAVYYTTKSIDARILLVPSLNNNLQMNLQYYLYADLIQTTFLITKIEGYFELPAFQTFSYQYLLIFPNNPWINTYIVIQDIEFNVTITAITLPLPSSYNHSGPSVTWAVQIRDIKYQCSYADLYANNNTIRINWWYALTDTELKITFNPAPYFTSIPNNQVRFLVVIIDQVSITKDFPQHRFVSVNTSINSLSRTLSGLSVATNKNYSNYMFGLSAVRFIILNQPSFFFKCTPASTTSNDVQYTYGGNNLSSLNYWYIYTRWTYFICNNPQYPYFNRDDLKCYQNCNYDNNQSRCLPCKFDCVTCQDAASCLTCNTTYRYLSGTDCIPLDGYYESNVAIPFICDSSCVTCQNTSTNCSSCKNYTQILSLNNTCIDCSSIFEGCFMCNQTNCLSCISGYRLINATFCNKICANSTCHICVNYNPSHCLTCNNGYLLNSNTKACDVIVKGYCGDGIVNIGETCDDNNTYNWDGCNSTCQIQQDYNCYNKDMASGQKYTHYCAYIKPIDFLILSIQKLDFSNQITLIISVTPYQHKFWSTQAVLSACIIQAPIPYRNMRVEQIGSTYYGKQSKLMLPTTSKYDQSSLIKITFEYLQSIQNKVIIFGFNFSKTNDFQLIQIPLSNLSFSINPGNNRYAHLYSENIYKTQKIVYDLSISLSIAAIAIYVISCLFIGKKIIVEMLTVIQFTYIGLMTIPELSPIFAALTGLSTANNGYNILQNSTIRPFEDVATSERLKGVSLYSQFIYNINTGLLFVFTPMIVGLITLIYSKIKKHSEQKLTKLKKIYHLAFGEYTFTGLIFVSCIVGSSLAIQIKFGIKQLTTNGGIVSLIGAILMIILYPLYGYLRIKYPSMFQNRFAEDKLGLSFQLTHFYLWLVLSAFLTLFYSLWFINCFVITVNFIIFILTITKPIFKKSFDKYRTQFNILTIIFIQFPYLYTNLRSGFEYKDDDDIILMAPAAIILLLYINFTINLSFLIYETYKYIKTGLSFKKKVEQIDQQHDFLRSKNILIDPLNSMKLSKNGFIQYSEKGEDSYRSITQVKKLITQINKSKSQGQQKMWTKIIIANQDYVQNKFNQIDQL